MSLTHIFKKKQKEFPNKVVLYLSPELNKILVAPQYIDESWLTYEQEEIEILDFECSNEILGETIKRNFDKFTEKNMMDKKRTSKDWPAYQASKLRSVKEFETKYNRITLSGANEANIIMTIIADMKLKSNINLTCSISAFADNEKLGALIRKLNKIQISKKFE